MESGGGIFVVTHQMHNSGSLRLRDGFEHSSSQQLPATAQRLAPFVILGAIDDTYSLWAGHRPRSTKPSPAPSNPMLLSFVALPKAYSPV